MYIFRVFIIKSITLAALITAGILAGHAAAPDPATVHAWYQGSGLARQAVGQYILSWTNSATSGALPSSRNLVQVNGAPIVWNVLRPGGAADTVARFEGPLDGLWASKALFGSIPGSRSIVAVVRLRETTRGFLFDCSTFADGLTRAQINAGQWQVSTEPTGLASAEAGRAGVNTAAVVTNHWQVHTFIVSELATSTFRHFIDGLQAGADVALPQGAALSGLILGNCVAPSQGFGLEADIAEVLVYDRALDDTERQSVEAHLTSRWSGTVDGVNPLPPPPLVLTSQPFKSGTNGYHTFRIPAMVVSNLGTIIAAADGRLTTSADLPAAIDCIVRRSTDRGDTWGPHIVVADYGTDTIDTDVYPILGDTTPRTRTSASDPALLVDRTNGRIWILYDNGSPTSYAGFGRTIKLEMRHSDDDGLTWSPRIDVEADNPGIRPAGTAEFIAGPGNGIQLERGPHAGRLIFPVYWYRSDNHSTLIISDDHGTTWRRGGRCGSGVGEVQIVECVNGDLLASMRPSGAGAGYRWFSRSTDGGDTWSALFRFDATSPTPVPDPTCQGSIFRLSTTAESDANRLIHASPASTSSRVAMTLRMSRDEGASWPVARRVYAGGSAYSALARLPDGDIALLFEKDGYQSIDFVRVRLDELTEGLETRTDYENWLNTTLSVAQRMTPGHLSRAADLEPDGLANGTEFAFGGDPLQPGDPPHLLAVTSSTAGPQPVRYRRRLAALSPGLSYHLDSATSPAGPWTPAPVSPVATEPDLDGVHEHVDVLVSPPAGVGAGAWYVRIRVEGV